MTKAEYLEKALNEMKEAKAEAERRLKNLRGCGSSKLIKDYRKQLKDYIERMSFNIWKAENPESFENHRKALSEFVESGCFNPIFA